MNMLTADVLTPARSTAALDRLGDEIAELSAHLEAATARLLDLIREFDARQGWSNGFTSCAHWLSWRVGLDPGAAREKVGVARAPGTLPRLARALARGELSYAKVRALTRVATPETEERLLGVGRAGTAEHVERIVRGWRRVDRNAEAREAATRHRSRALHVYRDDDGMVRVRGRLEHVSAETSRRLACDASRVVMQHARDGRIVEVAAKSRTIPPALRRALHHRDRGCRFPGCGVRLGQGHHIRHWAQGGPTTLSNLAMLCRRHHRAVHEEGYQVARQADGQLQFRRPDGHLFPEVPPPIVISYDALRALRARNKTAGLVLHSHTLTPGWLGERLDVGYAIDVLHPRACGG